MGVKRLMIDRVIPTTLDDATLFFVVNDLLEMLHGVKTAFVNRYLSNQSSMDFAIMVAVNRGAFHEVFATTAAAEVWLLK